MNPEHRLGWHGADDIKRHPWFASIDWHMLEAHRIGAPMIPKLQNPQDQSNFANYDAEMTPPPQNTRNDRNLWQMWEWVDTSGMHIHDVTAANAPR